MMTGISVSSTTPWRMIIIEDCLEDREEIRRLLLRGSDRRYKFVEAETGAAGVRAILDASGGLPDCVVLDYFLPDINGKDVLSAVMGPNGLTVCPVVVLTGSADMRLGQTVLRAGAQDFIGKAWITAQSLTRAVENAAERWAMARELQTRTAALQASQQQLQLAVDLAGLGVNRIDYRTDTIVLDTIAAELFGLKADEALTRSTIHATFHPDDADEIFRLINRSLDPTGDGMFVMEHRVVHRDGSIRWLSVKKQVMFGVVSGIRGPVSGLIAAVDITERKHAEIDLSQKNEQLAEADARIRSVVNNVIYGIITIDERGVVETFNSAAEKLFGYKAEEVVGQNVTMLMGDPHTRDHDSYLANYKRTGQAKIIGIGREVEGRRKDGSTFLMDLGVSEFLRGGRRCFTGVVRDITDRKQAEAQMVTMNEHLLVASIRQHELTERAEHLGIQLRTDIAARVVAEEALRESQHFIHSVLYNLFAFVGIMTVDGTLTDANLSSLTAAGIPASEVLGKKFWDCYWWSYSPEIQAQLRAACARAANGEVVRYDVPVRMAGDTRVWIDVQGAPLRDTKGRGTQIIPSGLEFGGRHAAEEALRESEERFRVMADGLPLLIWVHNAKGELQFVNQAYCEFFDVTPEQIAGENWRPLVHPEDLAAYASEFDACVRDRRIFQSEVRVHRSDGEWRLLESIARPRFSASGEFLGMVGSSPDITERKAAEMELSHHREGLQRAVEERTAQLAVSTVALHTAERLAALGNLAAGLGHDIANLTMPIRARLQSLKAASTTDAASKDIDAIGNALDHLSNLSAGMRLMSMDPDRIEVSSPAADLEAWCAETSQIFQAALPRHIRLECQVPHGLGVNIGRHRLAQAVFNLVQNAGEAMAHQPSGNVRVTAEAAISAAGLPVVKVLVFDDGPGMPAEVVARCFEPYFSTKGRAIATGMGLGMVRGIVESVGGTVAVSSALGEGTTFTLTLPAAVSSQLADAGLMRTAAVTIKGQRESSLAVMFLNQLLFKTHRHLDSTAPGALLWVVERPTSLLVQTYFDQNPRGLMVVIDGEIITSALDGRTLGATNSADHNSHRDRIIMLSTEPSPGDLRDAITRANMAILPIAAVV